MLYSADGAPQKLIAGVAAVGSFAELSGAITNDEVIHLVNLGQEWLSVISNPRSGAYIWTPAASIPAFAVDTNLRFDALEAELALH